jgi:hypothetical protein
VPIVDAGAQTILHAMKHPLAVIGLAGLLCVGRAAAQTPASKSVGHVREIYACMMRRMAADKVLSYNDAMKACKHPDLPPAESASNAPPPPAPKAP